MLTLVNSTTSINPVGATPRRSAWPKRSDWREGSEGRGQKDGRGTALGHFLMFIFFKFFSVIVDIHFISFRSTTPWLDIYATYEVISPTNLVAS